MTSTLGNRGRPPGFTLIELLVVLLIMGLLIGLVGVNARPDDRALLQLETDRLAQLLRLAATRAQLTGRTIAWSAHATDYGFTELSQESAWTTIDDDLLRSRTLPAGMTISHLQIEGSHRADDATEPMRVEFGAYGSGLVFSVQLSLGSARFAVAGTAIGDVRAVPATGAAS